MKVGLAADHAGFEYKENIKEYLLEKGHEVFDFGAHSDLSSDYADYAHPLGQAMDEKRIDAGIAICGSGQGMCMTLNKHAAVRAALVWEESVTRLTRQHNDANVLCLPARFISEAQTLHLIDIFLETEFDGGRHLRRIEKI